MPQFTRQSTRPLTVRSYLRVVRRLRHAADQIEANAARRSPQEKRALTMAIVGALELLRVLRRRHYGQSAAIMAEPPLV